MAARFLIVDLPARFLKMATGAGGGGASVDSIGHGYVGGWKGGGEMSSVESGGGGVAAGKTLTAHCSTLNVSQPSSPRMARLRLRPRLSSGSAALGRRGRLTNAIHSGSQVPRARTLMVIVTQAARG